MLTEFFAFQLHVTIAERSGNCSFVLRAPMSFSRAKREEALLRRIIQNENDLLRYLLLSSADEAFPIESRPKKDAEAVGYFGSGAVVEQALFETLTACLSNEPHKLHEFEKLMTTTKKKCRIVMLTSSINPQDVNRSKKYSNVKLYLNKPLTHESLMDLSL